MTQVKEVRFQVTMAPTELPVIGGWANGFSLSKQLTGDLNGSSEGLFINAGQAEGMRSYIVVERFTGTTPEGEPAGVILEHGGIENNEAAWFGRIVPGTGTGAWEGITGNVRFDSDADGELMLLTLD